MADQFLDGDFDYRALVEGASDGIFVTDSEGRFIAVNAAGCELVGYSEQEVLAMRFHELVSEERAVECPDALAQRQVGDTSRDEREMVRKDGAVVTLEINARKLENGTMVAMVRDTTARRKAEDELRRSEAHRSHLAEANRALATRLIATQEHERAHLARDLHDGLGQMLTALKMELQWLLMGGHNKGIAPEDEMARELSRLTGKVDDALQVVRGLAYNLRPPALDDLGVGCAVSTLAKELTRPAAIECSMEIDTEIAVPDEIATAVFRIAQEGLTNVVRHSGSPTCFVSLFANQCCISLQVKDAGKGLPADFATNLKTVGIGGIRERVALLDGSFTATSNGEGTTLSVRIPHRLPCQCSGRQETLQAN